MSDLIFSLYSWPQAIAHIDGDAFFTSTGVILFDPAPDRFVQHSFFEDPLRADKVRSL